MLLLNVFPWLLSFRILFGADSLLEHIDYETLTHEIVIEELRGGNHDLSGSNEYFFRVTAHGLPITKEEVGKKTADRKKTSKIIGEFGRCRVKSLSFAKMDDRVNLIIPGDLVRELTSKAMRDFKVLETRIAALIEIEMYEVDKEFIFFGQDILIGKAQYYVIPETIPHAPSRKNINLRIFDDKGTNVEFLVNYQLKKSKAQRIIE